MPGGSLSVSNWTRRLSSATVLGLVTVLFVSALPSVAGSQGLPAALHGGISSGPVPLRQTGTTAVGAGANGPSDASPHPRTALATINGTLSGYGHPLVAIAGANVTLVKYVCPTFPSESSCAYVNSTTTDANGSFALQEPVGVYFLFSHNTSSWGGDWLKVNLLASGFTADLLVYPEVPYGNATFHLPAWSNLAAYASNCNAQGPCGVGVYGT
ncbi:MAG: hypothetical protein L3K09_03530 [Thermoplasmata archaeon]|nr:hypothetical protein [Thermoplasmata archaeon]